MRKGVADFRSRADYIYDIINTFFILLVFIIVIYPLYFIVIASISSPAGVGTGKVILFPDTFNIEGYKRIFENSEIWRGYRNSVFYAMFGTLVHVTSTLCSGYFFTRRELPFRRVLLTIFIIPMFFSGGLIPTYLIISQLKLVNNPVLLIILGSVSMYYIVIARTFIDSTIPRDLFDASRIDGSNNLYYFYKIVIPLSKPLISMLAVFSAVGHWNSYFNALIYMNKREWIPLQLILREILNANNAMQQQFDIGLVGEDALHAAMLAESVKYGLIIVSSLPVIAIYPFAQKHFVKGLMIGSIKG
ncbi:TPA: carbohydrate ABC transporter permease [bacterium]|nr:carbohydrate ABC transporter permease [bacterium]